MSMCVDDVVIRQILLFVPRDAIVYCMMVLRNADQIADKKFWFERFQLRCVPESLKIESTSYDITCDICLYVELYSNFYECSISAWKDGRQDVITTLLNCDVRNTVLNISIKDTLIQAAVLGYSKVVPVLLTMQHNSDDLTEALFASAQHDNYDVFTMLTSDSQYAKVKHSLLLRYFSRCSVDKYGVYIRHIIKHSNTDYSDSDLILFSLHYQYSHIELSLALQDKRINPLTKNGKYVNYLILFGNKEAVQPLLQNERIKRSFDYSRFFIEACSTNNCDVVELLLEYDINADLDDFQAAKEITKAFYPNIIKLLLASSKVSDKFKTVLSTEIETVVSSFFKTVMFENV